MVLSSLKNSTSEVEAPKESFDYNGGSCRVAALFNKPFQPIFFASLLFVLNSTNGLLQKIRLNGALCSFIKLQIAIKGIMI